MNHLTVQGVPPYDGRYEFDLASDFTTREWGWIKRYSEYLPLTIDKGLAAADAELIAAFAIIALYRAGKIQAGDVPDVWERFADAPGVVTVRLEAGPAEEEDAGPPPESSSGNGSTSGTDSRTSSEKSDGHPAPTGTPASATSAFLQAT